MLAVASPALAAHRRRAVVAVQQLDRSTLQALGEVALPASIGLEARREIVAGFERWLAAYRGGAELLHGYGSSVIRRSPPSPAPKWRAQLLALDAAARKQHGRSFADLEPSAALAILESALEPIPNPILPAIVTAPHVALGLTAFWIDLPVGYDRAYGGHIRRFGCRPLAANPERPKPIDGGV